MTTDTPRIGLGFYSGLGDVFALLPAISRIGLNNFTYVFVRSSLLKGCRSFLELEYPYINWEPFETTPTGILKLLARLRVINLRFFFVSPHAPLNQASVLIAPFLYALNISSLMRITIAGDINDPFSLLYNLRLTVDRGLKLVPREWSFLAATGVLNGPLVTELTDAIKSEYDVFIHYGASSKNKISPPDLIINLLARLAKTNKVILSGLPKDIESIRMGNLNNVTYSTGSLSDQIALLRRSTVVVSHDTGFAHIAAMYNKPQIVLFGPTDPDVYSPYNERMISLTSNDPRLHSCMPCGMKECKNEHGNICMNTLDVNLIIEGIHSLSNNST